MQNKNEPYVIVLGTAQDGGYPQAGCHEKCCDKAWKNTSLRRNVSCIAIVDPKNKEQWIFDATPDIKHQLQLLKNKSKIDNISGVFLTHAHIGHYTGLMYFGKEAISSKNLPVYCMPKMKSFIKNNAPWSQLVNIKNISLNNLQDLSPVILNSKIKVIPFLVPHRNEYSETVGYKIMVKKKTIIFIPDIDKWEQWDKNIKDLIKDIDYAFLDATFYDNTELKRDMNQIPHPLVKESMKLFANLTRTDKQKIHFIHFNHTNPLLNKSSKANQEVILNGFKIADDGQVIRL